MAFHGDSIYWVEVEKIVENPYQPRREFDEARLHELADSVRMYGILQPLTVTRKEIQREDGTFYTQYELIAGERRLRASRLAGVAQVPVIIRDGEDTEQEKLELAIIENLQREDLNAVDRALAFRQLADAFGLSHTQVAKKVGRSREYVSNSIRILALPETILNALRLGDISEGHARTLLMLAERPEEQDVVFREILLKKLSVRETERISRKIATDKLRKREGNDFDDEIIEMEKRFTETLGTRVQIQKTEFGGRLTIDYFSVDDLESMLVRMRDEERERAAEAVAERAATLAASTPLTFPTESAASAATAEQTSSVPAPAEPAGHPDPAAPAGEEPSSDLLSQPESVASAPPAPTGGDPDRARETESEPGQRLGPESPEVEEAAQHPETEPERVPVPAQDGAAVEAEVRDESHEGADKNEPHERASAAEHRTSPAAERTHELEPTAARNDLASALQRALGGFGSRVSAPEPVDHAASDRTPEAAPTAGEATAHEAKDTAPAPSQTPNEQTRAFEEAAVAEWSDRVPEGESDAVAAPASKRETEEDEDLYSIRNFSI